MSESVQINSSNCQKAIKYILMALITFIAVRYIPDISLQNKEIIMISVVSSITFVLLDMISPSIKINIKSTKVTNIP